jgi:primosomal replication protein N
LNEVVIAGKLIECSALRYTPAGMPVLELTLAHESEVQQVGNQRSIQFEISIVAMGDLALMWQRSTLGQSLEVKGFLAPARRNSPKLVVHAAEIVVS